MIPRWFVWGRDHCDWDSGVSSAAWGSSDTGRAVAGWSWLCSNLSQHHSCNAGPLRCGQVTGDHWGSDGQRLYWQLPDAAVVRCDRKPHHDLDFSVLPAGDPDFDGVYARSAAKENEWCNKYRCSCIWGNAQEQRYFCMHINPAPAPEQSAGLAVGCSTPRFWMRHWGKTFTQKARIAGVLLPVCVGRHPPSQAQ